MGRKSVVKTEIQICKDRLKYLAGNWCIINGLIIGSQRESILECLGYKKNEDGKWMIPDSGDKSIKDVYKKQMLDLTHKINQFYNVLDNLPSEKLKHIAEMRYVEGIVWKDIADYLDEHEQKMYQTRVILSNAFKEGGCAWAIGIDKFIT